MANCDVQNELVGEDDDIVNVDTACPTPDDCSQNNEDENERRDEGKHANINTWKTYSFSDGDRSENGENANMLDVDHHVHICSWKTASFWDDRDSQEPALPDTMHTQVTQVISPDWIPVPVPVFPNSLENPVTQVISPDWIPVPVTAFPMSPENETAEQMLMMAAELEAEAMKLKDQTKTTVMLRNIPNNVTRAQLLCHLDSNSFAFDFLYLPIDFKKGSNLGYAFVNLVSPEEANRFYSFFEGFHNWGLASQKICGVCWGDPLQGADAHIERYRNSPVMHPSVPDEHKPMLFSNGQRMDFPPPTKRLRAPRTSDKK